MACGMRYSAISKRFDTIVEFTAFENFISFEKKCKNKYYLIHLRRGKKHKMSKRITLISFIEKNEIKKEQCLYRPVEARHKRCVDGS